MQEYVSNTALQDAGQPTQYGGYLSCFCLKQAEAGAATDALYNNAEDGSSQAICSQYWSFNWWLLAITNGVTGFVVVVNTILTELTIRLITWIGYDTQSEMMTKITNGIFVAQFFNTALIYLLVYANFGDTIPSLSTWFRGPYLDYDSGWYSTVGASLLVYTMLFNSVFPQIMQVVSDLQVWFARRKDQSWEKDPLKIPYATKLTQVTQYIHLYSGQDYIVHFRYSGVLTTVYVTMMYGVGIPVLFPIAAFTLGLFWLHEKYHMAYNYQLPPSFDDKLTNNCIQMLRYSPILLLFNGYWMLSNQQIFNSVINFKETTLSYMSTSHSLNTIWQVSQGSPLLLIGIAVFAIFILQTYFAETLTKWGFGFSDVEIEVDENLPNFFKAVKLSEADWLVSEDKYYKDTYDMDLYEDKLTTKLDDTKPAKAPIQGIHWYTVLANPTYGEYFGYINVNTPSRNDLIVDDDDNEDNDCEQSDMVSLILNLAFISDAFVKDIEFGPGISQQLKGIKIGQRTAANVFSKVMGGINGFSGLINN